MNVNRIVIPFSLGAALLLLLIGCGGAPEPQTYTISGTTETYGGTPVAGVTVTTGDETVTSDADGAWQIVLPAEPHTVTASQSGALTCPFSVDVQQTTSDIVFTVHEGTSGPGNMAGAGTAGDPFVVTSADELQELNGDLTATYILCDDINAAGKTDFEPIAAGAPFGFQGVLDGRGYSISELHINDGTADYIGLFAAIDAAGVVQNLTLDNGSFAGNEYVGAVAGTNLGTIEHVENASLVEGVFIVGGIAGESSGLVSNVQNHGAIVATDGDTDFPVGGVVGLNSGEVTGAQNYGDVTGIWNVGGIAGQNDNLVTLSSNHAAVSSTDCCSGGIAGWNSDYGTISLSFNTGAIVVGSGGGSAGGLAGESDGFIENSYNLGSVTGGEAVGGITGYDFGVVDHTFSAGEVAGDNFVGGVVGDDDGGFAAVTGSYFDADLAPDNGVPGATAVTEAELQAESTFVGWDFDAVWSIAPGEFPDLVDNPRP